MSRPRIYLAGPEVFLPDAIEAGRRKRELCALGGFEGVYPLDGVLALEGVEKREQARRIYRSCEAMMRSCDALIANLTPFRGVSADSGTAFEVGFMRALGRPVLGYSNVLPDLAARSRAYRAGGRLAFDSDTDATDIEDFGLAENLMLGVAIEVSGSDLIAVSAPAETRMADLAAFRACLAEMQHILGVMRPA